MESSRGGAPPDGYFRKHKKKQAEDVKQQNTRTNDRKEESKLGDDVLNTAQHQLGDRKELEKKPEQPAPVLVVPPSLVYIEQDAYIPSGGMMPGSGLAPAAPPPVVMYAQPAYVLDPQPTGSLACLDACTSLLCCCLLCELCCCLPPIVPPYH